MSTPPREQSSPRSMGPWQKRFSTISGLLSAWCAMCQSKPSFVMPTVIATCRA